MTDVAQGTAAQGPAKSILVVVPNRKLPFIEDDLALLRRRFAVEILVREGLPTWRSRVQELTLRLRLGKVDLVLIWFADPYDTCFLVLAARMYGVPTAVIVGGYELAHIPKYAYGALTSWRMRLQLRLALCLADLILPTSTFLEKEVKQFTKCSKVKASPLGVDCDLFCPAKGNRETLVVTAGRVDRPDWKVKGLDIFAKISQRIPNADFMILGSCEDTDVRRLLSNMGGARLQIPCRWLGPEELSAWFQRATVYAQLSYRESFGVSAAEAMACGCYPVVSDRGHLPELVGPTGSVVPYGDVEAAADAIAHGLATGPSGAAREHILTNFSVSRRARLLPEQLEAVIARRQARSGD